MGIGEASPYLGRKLGPGAAQEGFLVRPADAGVDALAEYRRVAYCSFHTTAGYLDDYDEVCPYDGMAPDVVYQYLSPVSQGVSRPSAQLTKCCISCGKP